MRVAVPRETTPGERRVALVPETESCTITVTGSRWPGARSSLLVPAAESVKYSSAPVPPDTGRATRARTVLPEEIRTLMWHDCRVKHPTPTAPVPFEARTKELGAKIAT